MESKKVNTQKVNPNKMKTMTINLGFPFVTVKANINSRSSYGPQHPGKIKSPSEPMLSTPAGIKWCCTAVRLNREADDDGD